MTPDEWLYSTTHQSPCKILDERKLWGSVTCRVWLQKNDTVVTVPKETIQPLRATGSGETTSYHIRYLATAARIADLLEEPVTTDGVFSPRWHPGSLHDLCCLSLLVYDFTADWKSSQFTG